MTYIHNIKTDNVKYHIAKQDLIDRLTEVSSSHSKSVSKQYILILLLLIQNISSACLVLI